MSGVQNYTQLPTAARGLATHGHGDCPPGPKSFTYWLARETVLAFVWENRLSAGSKEGDVNRSVLYKRIAEAQ